jgi:hypothetical protein
MGHPCCLSLSDICTHTHTHTHAHTHTHVDTYTPRGNTHTHRQTYTNKYTYTHTHTLSLSLSHSHTHTHTPLSLSLSVSLSLFLSPLHNPRPPHTQARKAVHSLALYSWSVPCPSWPYCGLPAEYTLPLQSHMVKSAPQATRVQPAIASTR